MHRVQRTLCAIALSALTILPAMTANILPVHADIAPPAQAPGSNPQPSQPTKVQMLSEKVVLQVLQVKGKGNDDLPLAEVTASFIMRNGGSADESMVVRFPITNPSGWGDGFGGQPEIRNVIIKVNGKPVRISVVTTPNPIGPKEPDIKWAAFDATFPVGKDTFIEVSYALDSSGDQHYGEFRYILETGAGWDGPIGDAQIVLDLPYDATDENVVLEASTPNGVIANGNVSWEFKNLEPTPLDDFHVTMLAPSTWNRIVEARAEAQHKPNDARVWRDLAKAYRSAIFVKYGPQNGAKFVPLVEEAYAHAIDLDKSSAQLPAELAETLVDIYPAIIDGLDADAAPSIFAALAESFKRDPKNATALRLLKDLRNVLAQMASGSGEGAETAKKQLDALNKIAADAGVSQPAPVPATPPPPPSTTPITPTVEVTAVTTATGAMTSTVEANKEITPTTASEGGVQTSTATVSSTTDAGAVITTTTMTTATQTMTDTTTSRPVVVVTMTETAQITSTSDVAGTVPATVTEVTQTSVVTSMMPMPAAAPAANAPITSTSEMTATTAMTPTGEVSVTTSLTPMTPSVPPSAPPFSQVITASTTATKTATVTNAKTGVMTPSAVVSATDIATKTVEANPLDATKPATTTVTDVGSITSAPVVTDTAQPVVINTTTVTSTTTTPEAGSAIPAITSVITQTDVATATTKPGDANTPPSVEVVTQTKVESATVDSTGVVTTTPPVVNIVTSTLPIAAPEAGTTMTGTVTSTKATPPAVTGTITATVEVTGEASTATTVEAPTEEPIAATAEVTTTDAAGSAGATTPAASSGTTGTSGIGWLVPLLITYAVGGGVIWGLARRQRQD